MDLLSNLGLGFATATSAENLLSCLIRVILGTLIGVLPGIGATATIAMLQPITFQLEPVSSLILLAGIYYGALYGGSTTAILINMPGESSSAVTAIDGYQMACRGKAGTALAVAAVGVIVRGDGGHATGCGLCAAANGDCPEIWRGGIFQPDVAWPRLGYCAGARVDPEGACHGGAGAFSGRGGNGYRHRHCGLPLASPLTRMG